MEETGYFKPCPSRSDERGRGTTEWEKAVGLEEVKKKLFLGRREGCCTWSMCERHKGTDLILDV